MTHLYGFSTGSFNYTSRQPGVDLARRFEVTAIEMSSLAQDELDAVCGEILAGVSGFRRVGMHGPALRVTLSDEELVEHLDPLGVDVVMHPYVIKDFTPWQRLGGRLLVENSDDRKSMGQREDDLDRIFELVPGAGMCLDVSHAMVVEGPGLVEHLARRYHDRIRQLHVGCDSGRDVPATFEADLQAAARKALEHLTTPVTVIAERKTNPDDLAVVEAQAEALRALALGE